jgi:hypothetical protein
MAAFNGASVIGTYLILSSPNNAVCFGSSPYALRMWFSNCVPQNHGSRDARIISPMDGSLSSSVTIVLDDLASIPGRGRE